ncbi:MAG: class I SAM-dependent rRNA methyltransferase [Bacteroidaceae bacterium]|nr:class I SAM-dependent rRNA methyltransferase [Bacteroidaceae bacterium]
MYKKIFLHRGKDASVRRYHPWIFSGAISRMDKGIDEGDNVEVYDAEGEFLAVGHYQRGSIAVRILSFEHVPLDGALLSQKIGRALAMRRELGLMRDGENTIFRLVHGEGDGLPALIIDMYGPTAVIQAHSVGMHRWRHEIAQVLMELMPDRLASIYYKSDQTLPVREGVEPESGYLLGSDADDVAMENGLAFHIDWLKGQKTGFFIDQRDNRRLLEQYAHGRKVLNMFCYTGGFSVYALRGDARLVHSVDSSARAIATTDANVALNFPDCTRHRSYVSDAFRFLGHMPEDYDVVILDPPAFAKHRDAIHNAMKGYARLNAAAMSQMKSGGILFTFSCSQAITADQFRTAVFTAAARAHRFVKVLHQLHQPADHPVSIYHPEGEYLKGLVLYVE